MGRIQIPPKETNYLQKRYGKISISSYYIVNPK